MYSYTVVVWLRSMVGTTIYFNLLGKVLKNFAIFTGKHICWGLQTWKCNFLKTTPTQVFPVGVAKSLRNNVFYRTPPVAAHPTTVQ